MIRPAVRGSLRFALVGATALLPAAAPLLADAQPQLAGAPVREAIAASRARYAPASDAGLPTATAVPGQVSAQTVRVGVGAGAVRQMSLPRGKSAVVELPVDARDVMVSNPKVADVQLSTPRRIYVMGVTSGQTDATFVDGMGRQILRLDIRVDQDAGAVQQTISRLLPDTSIRVESANDSLILSGEASSAAEADKAARLAAAFVGQPQQVVNMIAVAGGEQVMLKVKIVEVNRSIIKQLGFDLSAITGQLGMPQYSFLKAPTYGVNGSYLGSASGGYAVNTTSQPVSAFPFTNLLGNLGGIPAGQLSSVLTTFLTGAASTLTASQTSGATTYLAGVLGTTTTDVTNVATDPETGLSTAGAAHTVTAASAGVTVNNIASLEQQYVNGGAGLTRDQIGFLNAVNSKLPNYNPATSYSYPGAQTSTYADRSNPATYVQKGVAGSTGLNQADAMLQAFERVGLVRTLAEPSLTAISGESAKFLAGGEFPVPVGEDATGRISVEFKQFGVGLGFTPVVLSRGRISLKISTEVSELTNVGSFTLSNTVSGTTTTAAPSLSIPGLNVRRAETVVELPSGGGMAIAGLMQSQTKQTLDSLPGLMQLPVLGALFRSRDYQQNDSELVVIVTPYLVKSVRPDQLSTPADGLQIADDLQTNLLGKINAGFNKPVTPATAGQTYQGPFGYVVD